MLSPHVFTFRSLHQRGHQMSLSDRSGAAIVEPRSTVHQSPFLVIVRCRRRRQRSEGSLICACGAYWMAGKARARRQLARVTKSQSLALLLAFSRPVRTLSRSMISPPTRRPSNSGGRQNRWKNQSADDDASRLARRRPSELNCSRSVSHDGATLSLSCPLSETWDQSTGVQSADVQPDAHSCQVIRVTN